MDMNAAVGECRPFPLRRCQPSRLPDIAIVEARARHVQRERGCRLPATAHPFHPPQLPAAEEVSIHSRHRRAGGPPAGTVPIVKHPREKREIHAAVEPRPSMLNTIVHDDLIENSFSLWVLAGTQARSTLVHDLYVLLSIVQISSQTSSGYINRLGS